MSAINIITQRNLVKQPQSVAEGVTAATYGITVTNPTFTNHGQDAAISDQSIPTVAPNRIAGNVDRKETTKVFEENTIKFTSKVMAVDKDFLSWLNNLPNNTINTPDESRTVMDSYFDEAGVEQFRVYRGCKPKDSSMSYDIENYLIIEATLTYKTKTEDTVGPTIGSGSFGTPNTGTPLIHLDAGAFPFIYNGVATSIESFSIDTTYNMASQNALGSVIPLFMKPTQREISGSSVIYKKDGNLQKDARAALEISAVYIIDTGNIAVAFEKFKLLPSGEELKGDDAEATKENKSWEAGSSILATSTVSSPPTSLAAVPGGASGEADLTWVAPIYDGGSSITDYLVEFKLPTTEIWSTFAHAPSASLLITVTGLTPTTLYDFRVSAVNATGTSSPSNEAQATSTT